MKKIITIFDKQYSDEKTAEGLAISWALNTGACDRCEYLALCENDESFAFPNDSPCMKKKAEMSGAAPK